MVPPNEPIGDDDSQDTPDWLAEGDLDSDDAMAWLEEIAAKYDPDFEKSTDVTETSDEEAEPATASAKEEALPDWLAEEEPVAAPTTASPATSDEDEEEEEGELPDWLKDEEPTAEPATPAAKAEDEEDGGLPDWLRDEEPAPAPAAESVEAELAWLREPIETPEAIVSEDSDELPDWLKDEEPVEPAIASMGGDDTEDALAWLNQHVAAQGVGPDEVVSEALKVDTPPTTPVTAAPLTDAEAEAVSDEELPDWLKEAGGTEAMAEALASEPSDFDLEDIPELEADDKELAWLADTLEVEAGTADDELTALFGDLEEKEEEAEEATVEPVAAVEEAEPAAEEEKEPVPAMAEEPAVGLVEDEDLPDWLTEEEPKPSPGLTDWLRSPEAEAEEEKEEEEEAPVPAMEEEPEEELAAEAVPAPPPAPSAPPTTPVEPVEIPAALAGDFMGQLNTAREKMQAESSDEALGLYENLVSHKQMLEQTISDMEYAAQSADKPDPRIRRVLGDALRASGRLQEALEAYRAALDEL